MSWHLTARRPVARAAVGVFVALLICACAKLAPAPAAAVEVATVTVTPHPVSFPEDYVGETEAINAVEIRPRVGGMLEKRVPIEGERVKAGDLLFVIDRQPYIAALAQAKAALAQNEAALAQSQRDLERAKSLSEIDAVSQQELDAAVAKNQANLASIDAGKATVRNAELNLGYAVITSPIDGVMSRALLRQLGRAPSQDAKSPPPFRIFLADGSEYPLAPRLNFIDPAVDNRTGTLALRLEVDNPQQLLHAGQFARVQVAAQQDPNAIVVPQRAVQDLQGKNYVWIVDTSGHAQQRDVRMGPRVGFDWQVDRKSTRLNSSHHAISRMPSSA